MNLRTAAFGAPPPSPPTPPLTRPPPSHMPVFGRCRSLSPVPGGLALAAGTGGTSLRSSRTSRVSDASPSFAALLFDGYRARSGHRACRAEGR